MLQFASEPPMVLFRTTKNDMFNQDITDSSKSSSNVLTPYSSFAHHLHMYLQTQQHFSSSYITENKDLTAESKELIKNELASHLNRIRQRRHRCSCQRKV